MLDAIFEEVGQSLIELQELTDEFNNGQVSVERIEQTHDNVVRMITNIRTNGLCRSDVRVLNDMGLTTLEEKFYSEVRTFVGADQVALESESKLDWNTIMVGGILTALTALLSFIVGKFLGKLFYASKKLNDANGTASSNTSVKVTSDDNKAKLDDKLVSELKSSELVRIYLNLPQQFHDQGFWDDFNNDLVDLMEAIDKDGVLLAKAYEKTLDEDTVREHIKSPAKHIPVPKYLTTYLDKRYKDLLTLMGPKLTSLGAQNSKGEQTNTSKYNQQSAQVGAIKSDIFDPKYAAGSPILTLSPDHLTIVFDEKDQKEFKRVLSDYQSAEKEHAKELNEFKGDSKDERSLVQYKVKQCVIFPIRVVIGTLNVFIKVAKAGIETKQTQSKLIAKSSQVLSKAEMIKLIKLVEKAEMDSSAKANLLGDLEELNKNCPIEKAIEIIGKVCDVLKSDAKVTESDLKGILFYAKFGNGKVTTIKPEEFYSVIVKVHA